VVALVISETILIFACYVVAAYLTLDFAIDLFLVDDGGWWHIGLVVLMIVLGLYFNDLYDRYRVRSRIELLQQFSLVLGVAFFIQAFLSYGRSGAILPRWTMVYGSALVLVVVPAWRIVYSRAVSKVLGAQRLLFLGTSSAVREIIAELNSRPELGMVAVGFLDEEPTEIEGATRLGSVADLERVIEGQHPDRIVVGMKERRGMLPVERLLELRFMGVHIEDVSSTYEVVFHRISTRDLRPSQLVFSADLGPQKSMVQIQGLYSWAIGLVGLILALPIMAVVSLLVRLTSPGPIFYSQTRMGLQGKLFKVVKFRSMYQDAEARTGAVWASKDDPRITPLGKWLRKLRLDELPQLLNVIRGDMSIVGPRPERPEFITVLQEKIPYYRQRLAVKPGVTGWAQINYKYGDTIEDTIVKLEYDLYYIKNLAPSLDIYIVFHTIKTVLLGRGAQ
jgi:sugar transferase (PEP-CTERM system associated)